MTIFLQERAELTTLRLNIYIKKETKIVSMKKSEMYNQKF